MSVMVSEAIAARVIHARDSVNILSIVWLLLSNVRCLLIGSMNNHCSVEYRNVSR